MKKMVKFGSGCASWGDNYDPGIELCEKGDIEYIGWDLLAELTMAILIRMRERNPKAGYVPDMIEIARLSLPACMKRGIKFLCDGGGANPEGAGKEILKVAEDLGLKGVKVGVVSGDEVPLEKVDKLLEKGMKFPNRDTGAPDPRAIRDKWVAASVYIGSEGIIDCLKRGANVVITGRVSDNALFVGPLMYEFGWDFKEPYWDRIGAAVTAGHIIECAGCCSGSISNEWRKVVDHWRIGYPICEFEENGDFVITKIPGSGGLVNQWTVKEHMVYEVHDPHNYIMPDGIADFTTLKVEEIGEDRVKVTGSSGKPRPEKLKLSIAYEDGWIAEGTFLVSGPDTIERAKHCERIIRERFKMVNLQADELQIDYLGINANYGPAARWPKEDPNEIPIRVAAKTKTKEEAEKIRREVTHMWEMGPVGMEVGIPSSPRRVINLWHTLIPREEVPWKANILE